MRNTLSIINMRVKGFRAQPTVKSNVIVSYRVGYDRVHWRQQEKEDTQKRDTVQATLTYTQIQLCGSVLVRVSVRASPLISLEPFVTFANLVLSIFLSRCVALLQ